jgi:small-conductance mechanosensitive channel
MKMADETGAGNQQSQEIDVSSDQDLKEWAGKLDVTESQLKEAVQAVGPRAADVEDHLKGSRATTNSERVHDALAGDKPDQGS